jgi:hypothetical protein
MDPRGVVRVVALGGNQCSTLPKQGVLARVRASLRGDAIRDRNADRPTAMRTQDHGRRRSLLGSYDHVFAVFRGGEARSSRTSFARTTVVRVEEGDGDWPAEKVC